MIRNLMGLAWTSASRRASPEVIIMAQLAQLRKGNVAGAASFNMSSRNLMVRVKSIKESEINSMVANWLHIVKYINEIRQHVFTLMTPAAFYHCVILGPLGATTFILSGDVAPRSIPCSADPHHLRDCSVSNTKSEDVRCRSFAGCINVGIISWGREFIYLGAWDASQRMDGGGY
jgi:hypothetical protein